MFGSTRRCNTSCQLLCFISPWQTFYNLRHDKYFGGPYTLRRHATSKIIPSPLSQQLPYASFHDSALPLLNTSLSFWQNADQLLSHSNCLYPQTLLAVSCSHKCQNLSTLTFLRDGETAFSIEQDVPHARALKHTHPLTIVHCGQTVFAIERDAI